MSPLIRRLGVATIAAALLIAGAVKLWATSSGVAAAAALFGAGIFTAGIAVREWISTDRRDENRP